MPNFAPIVKAGAKGVDALVDALRAGKNFVFPQEEAMLLAQQRAALPLEKGGLGLPATNTAAERAAAMGFDTPVYHGTNAEFSAISPAGKGKTSGAGAFVTDNPLVTETYISGAGEGNVLPMLLRKDNLMQVNARGKNWADITTDTLAAKGGKKRYSLDDMGLDKWSATSTDELAQIAKELGHSGIEIKNVKDLGTNSHIFRAKEYLANKYGIVPDEQWSNVTGKQFAEARDAMSKMYDKQKSTITAVQDPDLLRSTFAAFDPWRKTAATAAAMGVAAPDLLAQELRKK